MKRRESDLPPHLRRDEDATRPGFADVPPPPLPDPRVPPADEPDSVQDPYLRRPGVEMRGA